MSKNNCKEDREDLKSIHPSCNLVDYNIRKVNSATIMLTKKELNGWYAYDWANSVYSSVALSGFLSLALQEVALENAGFPSVCPNIVSNSTLVHQLFPERDTMYFLNTTATIADCIFSNGLTYCPGTPSSGFCYEHDGITPYVLRAIAGSISVDPDAFFSFTITISKILQVILFFLLGALADYGNFRRCNLFTWIIIGSLSSLFIPLMNAQTWWIGFFVVLIANTCFGVSLVFYNSFLPVLSSFHPSVYHAQGKRKELISAKIQDEMSSTGAIYGYISGVLALFICVPIVYFLGSSGYIWSCFFAGLWWLGFSIPTFLYTQDRPGPVLPEGKHYLTYNCYQYWHTFKNISKLPNTFRLLLAWFLYSDSFSTISSLAVLMANTYINWFNVPSSIGLVILMIESPFAALLGTWTFLHFTKQNKVESKTVIYICLILLLLVCIYASLLTSDTLLNYLNSYYYLFIMCFVFGFSLGPVQSYSRSLFSMLIPEGHESEFFALYEISDKGSSWIGPLAISLCSTYLNNMLYAFYLEVIMLVLSIIVFYFVDVKKGLQEVHEYEEQERNTIYDLEQHKSPSMNDKTPESKKETTVEPSELTVTE